MRLRNIAEDFNLNSDDSLFLIFILSFTFLISVYKIRFYNDIGFNSDVPFYLSNALYYAGMNPNNILSVGGLYNSPTICFVTSLLFRMGFVEPMSLYIVTAVFEIFGCVGIYVLFRHRFNPMFSALGVVFYESTYLFLSISSSGLLDGPAVAVSVWILVFAMAAIDRNPRYFTVTAVLFVIGMFTRPTVGFILPVIFLYYFTKHDVLKLFDDLIKNRPAFKKKTMEYVKSREFRYIIISLILCAVLYAVVIIYHSAAFDLSFNYISRASSSMGGFKASQGKDIGYNPDPFYYVNNFLDYIAYNKLSVHGIQFSSLLVLTLIFGLIVKALGHLRNISYFRKMRIKGYYYIPAFTLMLIAVMLVSLVVAQWGFSYNHFITNIALSVAFTILICMLHKYDFNTKNTAFSIINLYWMVIYLVFISYLSIKVHRYFLPALVPVAYFAVLAIEAITDLVWKVVGKVKNTKKSRHLIYNVIPIVFILILLFSAAVSLHNQDEDKMNVKYAKIYDDALHTCNHLKKIDPDYMDKNITTDHRSRFYNWFLQRNTTMVDNLYEPVSMFDESGSDYLFLNESVKFENYTEIYHHGHSYLYNRTAPVELT